MNPIESAALLAALCDTLLPGEGNYPCASLAGTHGIVANRLRERYGAQIFTRLAQDLRLEGTPFLDLDPEQRIVAVTVLETRKPEFFTFLLQATYLAYYATPAVIEAIRLDGHIYNDTPLPLGYELTPFSFTPGVDVPLDPKGSFKWTFMMEPIDISSLADLDLPRARKSA